jgi:GH43 family beta-xylosidase
MDRHAAAGADPDVLLYNDTYYFYSTNPGNNVFTSKDLVHWTKGPSVLPAEFKGAWAPEVYHDPGDGTFYMYYTKRYKIGVAVSDTPDGMFRDLGLLVINAIDADIFRDDDGRLYLYFTNTPTFTMYCVPLKSPTETGQPITKCFQISQDWERRSAFPVNEGPWMVKHDGRYYLLYSGSDGQTEYYAVGYATAPTPIGPFVKNPKNPVFENLPTIKGPGHGSVVRDRAGQLWHVYHQKIDEKRGWVRDICIDRMAFDSQGNFTGKPTRGVPQAAPVCDPTLTWSPDIHPRGAVFDKPVTVTLTSNTAGAEIRYTLDGSEPTVWSTVYRGPFSVSRTTTVKARAWKGGMKTSTVSVSTFTHTDGPLAPNDSPNGETVKPPFEVFRSPNLNWKPPVKVAGSP